MGLITSLQNYVLYQEEDQRCIVGKAWAKPYEIEDSIGFEMLHFKTGG